MKRKTSFRKKIIISALIIMIALLTVYGIDLSVKLFRNNINSPFDEEYLYIPTGSSFEDVVAIVKEHQVLRNTESFQWVAEKMKYTNIRPGRYQLKPNMHNVELIKLLRSGKQSPVKVSFRDIRLKTNFAGHISKLLEADSAKLLAAIDSMYIDTLGFTKENIYTLFIPNTYELYWNTNEKAFMKRMLKEYQAFWNTERLVKANALKMSSQEVGVLASIVDQEALINSEMPRISGVYINRLRKKMKLEADPTVIFANGDFSIQRVLNKLLRKDSPYNTYMYRGLPPGPISMPSQAAIDAVLNYETHSYLYFCAKDDFSGYHAFASSFAQHKENARKFQRALSARGIKK